jgi:hypothetical protein
MTTPTDGEWLSAKEALQSLTSRRISYLDAVSAICTRAHARLVAARAKTFIYDGKRHCDVDVPPNFWWAEGDEGLTQDWATGYFETWVDHGNELYVYLSGVHGLSVKEFNSGNSPVGISVTDHLQNMLDEAGFAFLILTGDDAQASGDFYPRLNVVHEAGLFQGKLGFQKAIIFIEDGCQGFSNVDGLTAIRFEKGKIEAKFHQAIDVLKREGLIS